MSKKEQIQFYKTQIASGTLMIEVADQNKILATRLVSEAKKALEKLGSNPEPKKPPKIDAELKLNLIANLTKNGARKGAV